MAGKGWQRQQMAVLPPGAMIEDDLRARLAVPHLNPYRKAHRKCRVSHID